MKIEIECRHKGLWMATVNDDGFVIGSDGRTANEALICLLEAFIEPFPSPRHEKVARELKII